MGLFKNKEPTVLIRVTDFERRIIITALRNLRDKQIKENKRCFNYKDRLLSVDFEKITSIIVINSPNNNNNNIFPWLYSSDKKIL